mmetsp:Transcript_49658/g.60950  ORF Transcript_49658/g.60950 Transcript_49658/m.60950 type:complete len:227 (-) Transcript_49658:142-822(-)
MTLFIDAAALLGNVSIEALVTLDEVVEVQFGAGLCIKRPPPNDECPCFGQLLDEPGDICMLTRPGIVGVRNTLNALQSFEGTVDYYNRICVLNYDGNGVTIRIARFQLNAAELGRCVAQVGLYEQQTTCIASDIFSEFASYSLNGNHLNAKELEIIEDITELSVIDQLCLLAAVFVFILVLSVGIKQVCLETKPQKIFYDRLNIVSDIGSSTDTTIDNDQRAFIKH